MAERTNDIDARIEKAVQEAIAQCWDSVAKYARPDSPIQNWIKLNFRTCESCNKLLEQKDVCYDEGRMSCQECRNQTFAWKRSIESLQETKETP